MVSLSEGDALLIVDVQHDFLPGGSLAVSGADTILPVINSYIARFTAAQLLIIASRDYHPEHHISFQERNGPWPPHCIAGSHGAAFPPELLLPDEALIISKGTSGDKDAYSAMDGTSLHEELASRHIRRLFVCGLATDYCVYDSAKDLLAQHYSVVLLTDAVKAVNVQPGDGERALAKLITLGASTAQLNDISQ